MSAQIEYKEPRLYFKNVKGIYVPEYIPSSNFKFMNWVRLKYVFLRQRFGKDIYYWHIRHDLSPEYRKTCDIEFIRHVITDHDSNPKDPVERRHYNRAWALYGPELTFVLKELEKDTDEEAEKGVSTPGHVYAYAYKDNWFKKFLAIERKILYHGIDAYDYPVLHDLIREREVKQYQEYCKEHNLDPNTSKPLSTKQQRKSRPKARKSEKSVAKAKKNETSKI